MRDHLAAFLVGSALALLAGGAALAQGANAPPDQTGRGGSAATTITAPNTNSLGVTKPPPGAADRETAAERRDATRDQQIDREVEQGICKGCD